MGIMKNNKHGGDSNQRYALLASVIHHWFSEKHWQTDEIPVSWCYLSWSTLNGRNRASGKRLPKTMENHHFYDVNQPFQWPFSIANS